MLNFNAVLFFKVPLNFTVSAIAVIGSTTVSLVSTSTFTLPPGTYPIGSGNIVCESEQAISQGINIINVLPLTQELRIGDKSIGEDPITGNPIESFIEIPYFASLEMPKTKNEDFNDSGVTGQSLYLSGRCVQPTRLPKELLNYESVRAKLQRAADVWVEGTLRLELAHASRFRFFNYWGDWISGTFQL